jgi:hypothetical protein
MATRDGSADPALKFHPTDSPAAAPIKIHLRISKNVKLPPICAFLIIYNKLPKLRTWVRFPSPLTNDAVGFTERRPQIRPV